MNFIENGLKLGLLTGAAMLAGCLDGGEKCDTGDSACICEEDPTNAVCVQEDPCDADPSLEGCPCDKEEETGIGQLYYLGGFESTAGEVTSAYFGLGLYNLGLNDWGCQVTGELGISADPAPAGCPDCEWAFTGTGVTGSTAVGDSCDTYELADGDADTMAAYGWGFANVYYYEYNGSPIPLENTVFLYYDGEWLDWAFNYGGRNWVYGDAESVEMVRPGFTSSGYAYYYYYTGVYNYDPEGCTYVE